MRDERTLEERISEELNKCSAENTSNTPDFILAEYLIECLNTFNFITKKRDRWYGVHLEPCNKYFEEDKI